MSKHTPGPWVIQRGPHSDGHFEVGSDDGGGFFTVARVKGFSRHDAEANARLIATAPKLLEACKRALPYLADHIGLTLNEGPGDRCAYDLMEEAITEAEGQ